MLSSANFLTTSCLHFNFSHDTTYNVRCVIEVCCETLYFMKSIKKIFRLCWRTCLVLTLLGFVTITLIVFYLEKDLPDVSVLNDIQLQTPLRIFTRDKHLIAEYGQKRRTPVPFDQIPKPLIDAILATEDQRFYDHPGVDFFGLLRASVQLVTTGQKTQGGSTITMQVARNFFLSRKKTYIRKLKEILLAIKIDNELSKETILNLYLNKIYLGNRAYGVAAAAQVYYGKSLNHLNIAQLAMIAGLPKAPSALNPIRNPVAAKKRRNHVLARMYEQEYIDKKTYEWAVEQPITAKYHDLPISVNAPHVAELIRSSLYQQYGEKTYTMGLNVYTTLDSELTRHAEQTVHDALIMYDKRHGYRGAVENLGTPNLAKLNGWLQHLKDMTHVNDLQPAIITKMNQDSTEAILKNGEIVTIPWGEMSWARRITSRKSLGSVPKTPQDVVTLGDVVYLQPKANKQWSLAQIPEVEAAFVAMDPNDGAILALTGGFNYQQSKFNRATQAKRQPGSSFKPFIYAASLNHGFTLASIINDAPFVLADPAEQALWRPQNSSRQFYGPTRLREGLTKSRNLVSIRLLDSITIPYALEYIKRFGFDTTQMPQTLSLALGTGTVTPLELTRGYAILANGGFLITPYLIEYITDSKNTIIYRTKTLHACEACLQYPEVQTNDPTQAPQVIDPKIAYLMTSALRDVIVHGTGKQVRAWGLRRDDIAGKTGTTNDQKDAWFAGFNSDIAAVAWVGFDQPRSLGEYGAKAALPMWTTFMKKALKEKPEHTMPQPPRIVSMLINSKTGKAAHAWQKNTLFELFSEETAPPPAEEPKGTDTDYSSSNEHDDEPLTLF
jgi:penicillin-binding protein 1A